MANTDKFKAALLKALAKIKTPSNMRVYGDIAADAIRVRTRLGYGVKTVGGARTKLKDLKDATIAERKRLKKKGKLSEFTTPGRSNLTRTGQLLESQDIVSVKEGEVIVGPTGDRKDGLTNKQLAEYVAGAGRDYNNLSNLELKKIQDQIRIDLQEAVDSELK